MLSLTWTLLSCRTTEAESLHLLSSWSRKSLCKDFWSLSNVGIQLPSRPLLWCLSFPSSPSALHIVADFLQNLGFLFSQVRCKFQSADFHSSIVLFGTSCFGLSTNSAIFGGSGECSDLFQLLVWQVSGICLVVRKADPQSFAQCVAEKICLEWLLRAIQLNWAFTWWEADTLFWPLPLQDSLRQSPVAFSLTAPEHVLFMTSPWHARPLLTLCCSAQVFSADTFQRHMQCFCVVGKNAQGIEEIIMLHRNLG